MTQEEFDDRVLTIANTGVDRMVIIAAMRRQGDPKARELEEDMMLFSNVMNSLQNYDITSTLLSANDIDYLFELATLVLQTKP